MHFLTRLPTHPAAAPTWVPLDPMTIVSGVLTVGSTILSAVGQQNQAAAQEAQLNYEAAALRQNAQAERGAASYEAAEEERKKNLAIERAQAVAAASGAGAQDVTVLNDEGNLAKQGSYNAMMRLANGEQRARGLETQASADTFQAGQIKSASKTSMFGSILSGATSFFSKYGGGGFNIPNSIDSGFDYSMNPGLYPPAATDVKW